LSGIAPFTIDGFFAVQEQQLDRVGILAVLEHAAQFEHGGGARCPVAGANETELAKQLRVEVRCERDALGPFARDRADDVRHLHASERRVRVERLFARFDARGLQLIDDVAASLANCGRTRRTRSERHLAPQVLPGPAAVELRRRGWRLLGLRADAGDENARHQCACGRPQPHAGVISCP
jgi:hypothetical protein